eukprot:PITA_20510
MALVGECVETEPSSFEEAVHQPIWVNAMVEEYDFIVHNSVWDVVPRPENKSVVSSRWLYKVKQATDGSVEKHKARFVALSQVEGIDYHETFAPIARRTFAREFKLKDMGLMHYFLSMEVWQKDGELFVSQGKYTNDLIKRFNMEKCKPMQTPLVGNWRKEVATSREEVEATVYRQFVDSLMYLMNTQPDLCYAVNQLSQAMVQPTKMFWKAEKHVLRYFKGISQYGLWYRWTKGVKLQGFTNADWAGSPSNQKSTSGEIFNLGSVVVSWYSKKQRSVALSSAEAEYLAASQVACEAILMRKILVGLFDQRMDPTMIYCDNQSCIKLSENPVFHDRSKHINIWYHHLRDCVARRIMLLQYISEEQDADILTKALSKCKFKFHRDKIGVADNPFLVERES